MRAVMTKVAADVRRRRLQVAVVFVTALLAVGTGTMALTLMSQTRDTYQTAFEAQRGAHLQVTLDGRLDPRAIADTPALIGASAFGGPYPATDMQLEFGGHKYAVAAIGRDDPGGPVEQLRITAGHWPTNANEIALTHSFAQLYHIAIGDQLKVVSIPQEPELTVAAEVFDIDEGSADVSSQHAWVISSAIPALSPKDASYYYMDYRFAGEPTSAQLQADANTLRGALPAGSVTSSVNYLVFRNIFNISNQLATDVLLAFSIFALLATAAIVANLITGIVIAAYREIGVMKALGFTPLQVGAVFVLQILIPVAAAAVLAIPLGTIASQPLLAGSAQALGLPAQQAFSPALDAVVLIGALVVVTAAALVPAMRAGLLKPVAILTNASAPRGHSGRWLRGLAARVHLPRPVALGAGDAFARPLRALLTLIAIFVGVITVTVSLGLPRSLAILLNGETNAGYVDVVVRRSPALADADATRIINADPQTSRVVGELLQNVGVPGIGDPVLAGMFRGDSSRLGFLLVTGRWYSGPGEAVAPRALMQDAHLRIGDRFTITVANKPISLLLVGEVYDATNLGHSLFLDWSTVSAVEPARVAPSTYLVTLTPGANVDAYVRRVAAVEPDLLDVQKNGTILSLQQIDDILLVVAAIVILIGIAGIFNTLLLNTRERLRETATLKALGMSPSQVMLMVAASAGLLALIGGVIAVPAGVGVNSVLLDVINNIGGNDTAPAMNAVFAAWELVAIPLGGVAVAMVAALLPGRWAARQPVAEVLRAE